MNICVQFVWTHVFISLEHIYLRVGLPDPSVTLTIWGTAKLFSKVLEPFYLFVCGYPAVLALKRLSLPCGIVLASWGTSVDNCKILLLDSQFYSTDCFYSNTTQSWLLQLVIGFEIRKYEYSKFVFFVFKIGLALWAPCISICTFKQFCQCLQIKKKTTEIL